MSRASRGKARLSLHLPVLLYSCLSIIAAFPQDPRLSPSDTVLKLSGMAEPLPLSVLIDASLILSEVDSTYLSEGRAKLTALIEELAQESVGNNAGVVKDTAYTNAPPERIRIFQPAVGDVIQRIAFAAEVESVVTLVFPSRLATVYEVIHTGNHIPFDELIFLGSVPEEALRIGGPGIDPVGVYLTLTGAAFDSTAGRRPVKSLVHR